MCPVYAMPTRPSPRSERLGTPNTPAIRFTRGPFFEASLVRHCYGLSGCSPPWTDRTKFPWPTGDFYIQASGGSVALPAAGYDYNSNWTPLLAGLSPAGMAASLAAPEPHAGFQSEGGLGCRKGREDARRTGPAVRCSSQPDHGLEGSAPGGGCRGVRVGAEIRPVHASRRCEDAARQDRRADADQRFFVGCAQQSRPAERTAMIDRTHDLSIAKQAKVLGISRGSVYYLPRSVSAADLAIMRRVDELHLEFPFAGSRMLRDLLNQEGIDIGRRHVSTLMKRMGIEALSRKPNTSKPAPGHKIYPYLLRGTIDRPNQVWAMDITYLPLARGFVYLAAVVDWFSRRVLSWRVSISLEAAFCIEALEEALARHGRPEIFNTDQGPQFTSHDFTSVLLKAGIAISMDGRGSWRDNVFVERL